MGQFTFAATALTALAVFTSVGPVLYTVAALLKIFPLAIVPALVQRRTYWPHAVLSVFSVILLSVPYFLHHPGTWGVFWRRNFLIGPGFGDGNYGLVQLLRLVVDDIGPDLLIWRFDQVMSAARIAALLLVSMLVVLSRRRDLILGICALILAHFVTYHQVWEHHLSAVLVVAALLLVAWNGRPALTAVTLFCMLILALPTPFAQLNANRDPAILAPLLDFPRYASYLLVAPKAIPTLALFLLCAIALYEGGLDSPRAALSRIRALLAAGRQREVQQRAGGPAQ
jgi:hypothetical protein